MHHQSQATKALIWNNITHYNMKKNKKEKYIKIFILRKDYWKYVKN